jgi:hypothetical protein
VREEATVALAKRGEVAEWALRRALAADPPLEVRTRGERILKELATEKRPELTRALRAVEALAQNDAAEARAVLEALARGAPESALTKAASQALERGKPEPVKRPGER